MATIKFNGATDVRPVTTSESKAAALTLAEAFAVDEVAHYFIDAPDTVH